MGTVFKPIVTKLLPAGAQVTERDGERTARWRTAQGAIRTAPVRTTGRGRCVAIESSKYLARYKDGQGVTQTVATGCRDLMAARAKLGELERRAELVRAGVLTSAEDAVATHKRASISAHIESYLAALQGKGVTPKHLEGQRRLLTALLNGCHVRSLADLKRETVERWLAIGPLAKRAPRTKNTYLIAAKAFANWLVDHERLAANPLARIKRADEHVDRRRQPRALTPDELVRLLDAARRRPLEQAGKRNRGLHKGEPGARLRLKTRAKLEALGRERALIYKVLVLTGLRLGELTSLRVSDVVLEGQAPHIVLDARNEKNRQGSMLPLRGDLRDDLAVWITGRDRMEPLFAIPSNLVKVFDRDLKFAGIAKRDERGRTACVHSLRHSFATLLSRAGVAPRVAQAAMRHSTIDLTMSVYTDPRLLDVAAALAVLPELPLEVAPVSTPQLSCREPAR